MTSPKIGARRLRKLADHLENNVRTPIRMDRWFNECGTPACAFGHACTIPAFKRVGLKIAGPRTDLYTPSIHGDWGFSAAQTLFGIDSFDANYIFNYHEYKKNDKRSVIRRIREVAKRLEG